MTHREQGEGGADRQPDEAGTGTGAAAPEPEPEPKTERTPAPARDHVDLVLDQWSRRRPDLDASPMAVIGRLKRLTRLLEGELRRVFAEHGLDAASFDVLATLRRSDPPHHLTPAQLMQAAMVTSGAVSQRLDRLEAAGLVARSRSAADARVVHVRLTDQGRAVIDEALPAHVANEHRLLAALDTDERDALADALRTLLLSLGDGTA
ncbi:MarR family winged helix-turn-helix transcriptional regulator [Streptomyces sp. NBC_00448]|uniref:MarR family winged helix-turn-helix transcriptional regulator n=1 Tax=Streptomyces sp. NBC_00448 TaxID=2903652 RepID=UPI002E1A595F